MAVQSCGHHLKVYCEAKGTLRGLIVPVGDTTTLNSFTKTGHSRLKLWAMLALE